MEDCILGWEILRNQCQYTVYTACILGDAVYILSITNAYLIRWGGGNLVVIDIKCIIYVLIPNCKPYINTRATPPNAPREVRLGGALTVGSAKCCTHMIHV